MHPFRATLAALPLLAATALAQNPPSVSPTRAHIDLSAGRLAIAADNSSLNQILREIARLTNMKITGGVADERVFGNYGPADPATVLTTLLNGTGSNMLLVLSPEHSPIELVLTPRGAGPTPPSPSSAVYDRFPSDDLPPQRQPRPFPPQNLIQNQPVPISTPPAPAVTPAPVQGSSTPLPPPPAPIVSNPSPDTTTTQQSPNGVKTPEQIYQDLLKLQQQQQQKPPP